MAFSADGKTLAAGQGDGNVKLWDTGTWQERATLQGHKDLIFCVTFAPDGGTLASTSKDGTVRLWSVPGGGGRSGRPAVMSTQGPLAIDRLRETMNHAVRERLGE